MDRTRRLLLGGVTAGAVSVAAMAPNAAAAEPVAAAAAPGWHDVRTYGAKGDGRTDDTAAIQAALDACEPGNSVYLPVGQYRTSAPVRIGPYITLRGSHGSGENEHDVADPPFGLKPLPHFAGDAVVLILDQLRGGHARRAVEPRVFDLTIDGSDLPRDGAEIDGIRAVGQIQHLQLRDVQIRKVTGIGINTVYNTDVPKGPQAPFCLHFDRVSVQWTGSYGIALNNCTDSVFHDVYALGCNGTGWWIAGTGNSTFTSCRAEWSGGDGFLLHGWEGVIQFVGCSTDRSMFDGVKVVAKSARAILQLTGCRLDRDGRNNDLGGGGYAGLKVQDSAAKVLADGLIVTPGSNDDGRSKASPARGVSVTGSAYTVVNSGYIDGVEIDWHDGGGNTVLRKGPLL
ncbi:right-handed parallel beta-helix repeat-containing protein [Streptomyces sp. DH8]|uniref:right-handed parallel beta-helix repeat-containing protein n=1 Tax=Streptomyces sp. DH8 TaxID=2857008 RepID=UPI001E45DCEB|nr:right-handed parallel beta-helix repeat-containing protein [Streptomyces sp. DH8]